MNKKLIFLAGAVVGAAALYIYMKRKTEQSYYAYPEYADGFDAEEGTEKEPKKDSSETSNDAPASSEAERAKDVYEGVPASPYLITEQDVGNEPDYDLVCYTYYGADGVLANEYDEEITDIEASVGPDAIPKLTELKDEVVFVRNDKLRMDIEITFDYSNYHQPTEGEDDA